MKTVRIMLYLKRTSWVPGLVMVILLGGCLHTAPESLGSFVEGVRASQSQFSVTVDSVNQLILRNEVDRIVTMKSLDEDELAVAFRPEDIQQWDRAFEELADYGTHLQQLTSPDLSEEFVNSTLELGESIKAVKPDMVPNEAIATGFANLGQALIQWKQEKSARRIMQNTDPAIQKVLSEMADAIGATRVKGVRATALSNWTLVISGPVIAFLKAQNPEEKRKQVLRFLDLRRKREDQDQALLRLRMSFLSLGAAHRDLAEGSRLGAAASIGLIIGNLKDTQRLYAELKANEEGSGNE